MSNGHTLFQSAGSFRRPQIVGSEREPVPPRYWNVLAMHMAGKQVAEIREECGYAESTIYGILKDERIVAVRQQLLKGLDDELEVLYKDAINAVRTALGAEDIDTRLKGADMFFKVQGKYKPQTGNTTIHVSAEDVALQIINQAKEPIA